MASPLILVNLKTYREGTGNRAHMIANAAQLVAKESGVTIGIAPCYIDLHPICHHFSIPVYAQHVDGCEPGANTGHITVDAIRTDRGSGVPCQPLGTAPDPCGDRGLSPGTAGT